MKLTLLIKSLGPYRIHSYIDDFEVEGISCHSKQVSRGFVFVAIKGGNCDGHIFIDEAIENGAQAVIIKDTDVYRLFGREETGRLHKASFIVVQDTRGALARLSAEFYGNPSRRVKVVGITGTNGKTTVSYLIEALLKEAGFLPAVIGTINYRFEGNILASKNTTPGPIELQSMLGNMLRQGAHYAIMEVSSHALAQQRVGGIDFHSAVFTNLTQDHLDYHKTLKDYFQAKARLFKEIAPGSFAVINNDDEYARRIGRLTKADTFTYAIRGKADAVARDIRTSISGTEFFFDAKAGKGYFRTRLIGLYNVYNILAAASWALREGLDLSVIKSAIDRFSCVPGRLERIDSQAAFQVFVDYAHTEDALRQVINALRQLSRRRIIVVFGCGGERDKTKRPRMGSVVSKIADYAIITNDNPRSEDPKKIIADIKAGINKENFCVIPEREEAIRKSLSLAGKGDIVLIAGKGHEAYQISKDKVVYFDDREVARKCLRLMSY